MGLLVVKCSRSVRVTMRLVATPRLLDAELQVAGDVYVDVLIHRCHGQGV